MFANPRESLETVRRTGRAELGDLEVLKDVWKELELFIGKHSRMYTCPACREPYQPILFAAEHGLRCFAHPAVSRARLAYDELGALTALAAALGRGLHHRQPPPPLPLGPVPSLVCVSRKEEKPGPVFRFTLAEDYAAALDTFASPRLRSKKQRKLPKPEALDLLEVGVCEWEAYVARSQAPCPGCGVSVELNALPAHLMSCEQHPEHQRAAVLEDVLESLRGPKRSVAGDVIFQRMQMRIALARLAGASRGFINGLSDCDVGKARVSESREEKWKGAISEAVAVLGG